MNLIETGCCTGLKNLDHYQYKSLLVAQFVLNLVMMLTQICYILTFHVWSRSHSWDDQVSLVEGNLVVLAVLATVILCSICLLLVKLMSSPTKRATHITGMLVVLLIAVYIVQSVVYYTKVQDEICWQLGILVLLVCLQASSLALLYRYWEFLLFNYDGPEQDSMSLYNSISDSLLNSRYIREGI